MADEDGPKRATDGTPNGSDPMDPEAKNIEERAAEGTEEEEDGQFAIAVEEHGRKVKLSTLIKRGTPVKYEFKLGGAGIKGRGDMGLIGFDSPDITLIVPCRAGKVEADPTYDPDGTIKFITIRQHAKPQMAYDAADPQARAAIFGEPVEA